MQIETLLVGALAWHPDERIAKSKEMAPKIISQKTVDSWKEQGVIVMRGCVVNNGSAELVVQISRRQPTPYLSVIRCKKNGGPVEFRVNSEPVEPIPATLEEFSLFAMALVQKECLHD